MGEVVGACTDEKLLTVGAGDNVVRLLPPLNVTEDELGEAVAPPGPGACRGCPSRPDSCGREAAWPWLRGISWISTASTPRTLRRIVDMGRAMKKRGQARAGRAQARRASPTPC